MTDRRRPLRCAFLTMDEAGAHPPCQHPAFPFLAELGWECEWLGWRSKRIDWRVWDAVYPAATYDYPADPAAFVAVLQAAQASGAVLVNPLPLIQWNLPKTYLRELQSRGVEIVPSRWQQRFGDCDLDAEGRSLASDRVVVKPVISTNATDTFLLDLPVSEESNARLASVFAAREFIVQPFVRSVQEEGEFSLFFFSGRFSHAIRKTPKSADYRVQEEHGGQVTAYSPSKELCAIAEQLLTGLTCTPVYARCDYVLGNDGHYQLMELELIEPSLYLETDEGSASRFAAAFDDYVRAIKGD